MARTHDCKASRREAAGAKVVPLPWVARRRPRAAPKPAYPHSDDPDDYPISDRTLLTVGACLALFIVASVWLLGTMRANAWLEDCLMAGHKNCARLVVLPSER
ncbi:MAG: hypothetical protein WD207_09310 [Xanthobacteraceae bacterium]